MNLKLLLDKLLFRKTFITIFSITILSLVHAWVFFMFPPNYGWWQTYAYLHESGLKLYQDINCVFPPLYILVCAALLKISDRMIVSTIWGFVMVLTIVFLMYKTLRLKYSFFISVIASVTAFLLSIENPVYIIDDYHSFIGIFIWLTLYLYLFSIFKAHKYWQKVIIMFLLSIATWGAFFSKQNIGLLLIVSCYVAYGYYDIFSDEKVKKINFLTFLVCSIIGFFVFMIFLPINVSDVLSLTIGNDSKGSIVTVLTNFIAAKINVNWYIKSLFVFFVFCIMKIFYNLWIKIIKDLEIKNNKLNIVVEETDNIILLLYLIVLFIFLLVKVYAAILFSFVFLWFLLVFKIIRGDKNSSIFFIFLALVCAQTMTAGFCIAGMFVIFAFAFAYILDFLNKKFDYEKDQKRKLFYCITLVFYIVLFVSVLGGKIQHPYNWWGLMQSPVYYAEYSLPYKELKYFKVDKATYDVFSTAKENILKYSKAKNDVYLYPHIPLFYYLHKKIPMTPNIVQWFDVISTTNIKKELTYLRQNPPRLVIILDPPWWAYIGHSKMKKSYLYQKDIVEYFKEQVAVGKYKLLEYRIYDDNIFRDKMNDYIGNFSVNVGNIDIYGHTLSEVYDKKKMKSDFKINNIYSNSHIVYDIAKHKLQKNDTIELTASYKDVGDISKIFGEQEKEEKFYVFKIYLLQE